MELQIGKVCLNNVTNIRAILNLIIFEICVTHPTSEINKKKSLKAPKVLYGKMHVVF